MADIIITRPQYDALMTAALAGDTIEVSRLRDVIDVANSIKRFFLYIRWQDVGGAPPPRIKLGKGWPQDQTFALEMDRAITREDVDSVLAQNTQNPTSVMVTPDRAGNVGWTLLDDYNFAIGA
jgi:hypothetical protein